MFESFRIAISNLSSNKLRTFLTMLGVTIGVAAVIILVSVGQAFEVFVRDQFTSIGVNLIFVIPQADERGEVNPLTNGDAEALSDIVRVPDVATVMPQDNFNNRLLKRGNNELTGSIRAVTPDYIGVFDREVVAGRFFDQRDMETNARVVVIEQEVADVLFPDSFPLGQFIRLSDVRFQVIGILDEVGAGFFGVTSGVFIPLTTAQTRLSGDRILSGERSIDFIVATAADSDNIQDAVSQIQQVLREERDINFRDDDDFVVFTQTEILDTLGSITGLLTVFLALLASISLIVGGIGIMNIMLVTVTERTREIGLRKAVGAQNEIILVQFLIEAVVLSLLGGIVGVVFAVLVSLGVSQVVPDLNVTVQITSIVLATFISVLVGVASGLYPANRAASLNPIDALRYE
jgi:putative ABC transport system permease protein